MNKIVGECKDDSVKACPFCGEKRGVQVTEKCTDISFVNPGYRIQAHCLYCGAAGPAKSIGFTSKDVEVALAVEEWNRRVCACKKSA